MAESYENLSLADNIDNKIRSGQHWSLLPNYGRHSSVIPSEICKGFLSFPQFPGFIGKLSSMRKNIRELRELKRSFLGATSKGLKHFIAPLVVGLVTNELKLREKEGASIVLDLFATYKLTMTLFKENLINAAGEVREERFKDIGTSIKSHLTKIYNENCKSSLVRRKKKRVIREDGDEEGEISEEDDFEVVDIKEIKQTKAKKVESKKTKKTKK